MKITCRPVADGVVMRVDFMDVDARVEVVRRRRQIVTCPNCGGMRRDSDGPHAPRWRDGVQVDCVGREVTLPSDRPAQGAPAARE